jgi:hypothetical protein
MPAEIGPLDAQRLHPGNRSHQTPVLLVATSGASRSVDRDGIPANAGLVGRAGLVAGCVPVAVARPPWRRRLLPCLQPPLAGLAVGASRLDVEQMAGGVRAIRAEQGCDHPGAKHRGASKGGPDLRPAAASAQWQ